MSLQIALLSHERRDEIQEACSGFTCAGPRHNDDPTIAYGDDFLSTGRWADLDQVGVTRTWGAWLDGAIVGYVALCADAVHLTKSEARRAEASEAGFSRFGCVQIAMLAVRGERHECDLRVGSALVEHAQLVGRERIGRAVGARFLTADVNPPAKGFYERCGFVDLSSEREKHPTMLPMVLDLWPRQTAG